MVHHSRRVEHRSESWGLPFPLQLDCHWDQARTRKVDSHSQNLTWAYSSPLSAAVQAVCVYLAADQDFSTVGFLS